jgi:outer membrane immunogenic protein
MKKALLAGAAIAALTLGALPATAADIANRPVYKAPVAVPVVYNWTGFYIGGNVGYGWGSKDWDQTFSSTGLTLDRSATSADVNGFLGGAQAGFNWQAGQWVFGVEGDWSWTNADGCSNHVVFTAYSGCTNVNWYATAAGRLGFAWDRTLIYGKGGVAFADENHFIAFNSVQTTNSPSETRTGWVAGAGIEYAFWDNWSVKVEYNHMDFGSDSNAFTYTANPAGLGERWDIKQTVDIVKLGVNYRFNWGAPVVARY